MEGRITPLPSPLRSLHSFAAPFRDVTTIILPSQKGTSKKEERTKSEILQSSVLCRFDTERTWDN